MSTILRAVRKMRHQTLREVSAAVKASPGYLSKIECGLKAPSRKLVEKLVEHFKGDITEMQLLYPEKFATTEEKQRTA